MRDCAVAGCNEMAWLTRIVDGIQLWYCRKHYVVTKGEFVVCQALLATANGNPMLANFIREPSADMREWVHKVAAIIDAEEEKK